MRCTPHMVWVFAGLITLFAAAHAISFSDLPWLELDDPPKYDVIFTRGGVSHLAEANGEVVEMNNGGMRYHCVIPAPRTTGEEEEVDESLEKTIQNSEKILQVLAELPCLHLNTGWWTYEFCYGRFLRQVHAEQVPHEGYMQLRLVVEFVLGLAGGAAPTPTPTPTPQDAPAPAAPSFLAEFPASALGKAGAASVRPPPLQLRDTDEGLFLQQQYGGGTVCDLNGAARQAKVKFFCMPASPTQIYAVDEPASCVYEIKVGTPLLCSVKRFAARVPKSGQDIPHIVCSPD